MVRPCPGTRTDGVLAAALAAVHRFLAGFKNDRSGIAAVEFALLLPIMVGLYIGGIEITDAYSIKRKVTGVSSTLADLVAQSKKLSKSEMENVLDAAQAVLGPYPVDELKVKVSGVWIDDKSVAKVVWGAARNDTADTQGSTVTLPSGVSYPETFLVVAEASYQYTPVIGYVLTGTIDLDEFYYSRPRLSDTVCYDNKCELP
jgi:Flp pilus assembly protein TadG